MAGEHGSYIRDDTQTNTISNNEQNRQHITVTLYEGHELSVTCPILLRETIGQRFVSELLRPFSKCESVD